MHAIPHIIRTSLLLLSGCVLVSPCSAATALPQRTEQITAAYLFNFLKFVEWPTSAAGDALHMCFVGAPGVEQSFQASIADKLIGAQRVVVKSLKNGDSPHECALVYFAGDIQDHAALLQSARATALTVGDAQNFTRSGGAIQLFADDNRLRFIINTENAKHAGLRISSNLLKLASIVEQSAAP